MDSKFANGTVRIRIGQGEVRELLTYAEPRPLDGPSQRRELLRWGRDEEGRWYSFSRFGDAMVESLSGRWFPIVAAA